MYCFQKARFTELRGCSGQFWLGKESSEKQEEKRKGSSWASKVQVWVGNPTGRDPEEAWPDQNVWTRCQLQGDLQHASPCERRRPKSCHWGGRDWDRSSGRICLLRWKIHKTRRGWKPGAFCGRPSVPLLCEGSPNQTSAVPGSCRSAHSSLSMTQKDVKLYMQFGATLLFLAFVAVVAVLCLRTFWLLADILFDKCSLDRGAGHWLPG